MNADNRKIPTVSIVAEIAEKVLKKLVFFDCLLNVLNKFY